MPKNPTPKKTTPINTYGYQPDGTWHFGDCTIDSDGKVEPEAHHYSGILAPTLLIAKPPNLEPRSAGTVLRLFMDVMNTSLGAGIAQRMVGTALCYAAVPYLIAHGHGHPGVWLHGRQGTGKTSTARWLAALYGFKRFENVSVRGSTHAGLTRILRQYSSLPVVFDDYQPGRVTMDLEAVVRGGFDRMPVAQALEPRLSVSRATAPLTTPIICAESASHDGATRSRYFHVDLDHATRLSDGDLNAVSTLLFPQLHLIGLALLKHHAQFGGAVVDKVEALGSVSRIEYVRDLGELAFHAASQILNP